MIGKLAGVAGEILEGATVVEVGGVGYLVRTPLHALPRQGVPVSYFIHTAVREDAIDLYGFPTREEHAFFKQLLAVSGVGPKTALGILNVADVKTLKRSIAHGDSSALTKVFGIGKKSAERVVVELRDKLIAEIGGASSALGARSSEDFEVIEALLALGYRADESRKALGKVPEKVTGTRDRLAAALKSMG
ncbi:Holliday junction DNA helicase RuvA [Candidatus Adlerbacteria bacterium RIFCSPHIGHO2_01_FULL_54_23]|nr:MAG: Holliday junction DNA helicase RuvA [Candidatus Adlerbacteria bacterium RIFCSPHIGHO2_01_FULL_54_23]OGC86879.1 MAG: Holliday junction DNA helicase RuvA [Candidatus Adlerbacteria bacterium RIFCSPLOWO2_01_FULL_54_16]